MMTHAMPVIRSSHQFLLVVTTSSRALMEEAHVVSKRIREFAHFSSQQSTDSSH